MKKAYLPVFLVALLASLPAHSQTSRVDIPVGTNGIFQMEVDCTTKRSRTIGATLDGNPFDLGMPLPSPWEPSGVADSHCAGRANASSTTASIASQESCFQIGLRYGRCVGDTLRGESCRPEDDVSKPSWCIGDDSFEGGLRAGMK